MNENALSIIQGVDSQEVANTLSQIAKFQGIINASLSNNRDYGVIPGTNKPTLLKPGAEKINMLLQTVPEYEFLEKTIDFKADFFNYEIKCTLVRYKEMNGTSVRIPVSQGVGSCNSHEKKYRWANVKLEELPAGVDATLLKRTSDKWGNTKYQIENPDVASLANTILKMAKKRAYVDATLQLAALSDIFTQDLEDLRDNGQMRDVTPPEDSAPARASYPQSTGTSGGGDAEIMLTFGKNKGLTLGYLLVKDKSYIHWLADKANDAVVRAACVRLLAGTSAPAKASVQNDMPEPPGDYDPPAPEDDTSLPLDI